jgi:hypothetical protein
VLGRNGDVRRCEEKSDARCGDVGARHSVDGGVQVVKRYAFHDLRCDLRSDAALGPPQLDRVEPVCAEGGSDRSDSRLD